MINCKKDFPLFDHDAHPHSSEKLIYLDSAASALKPQCVIDRMNDFYTREYANIHRGLYHLSHLATTHYEAAREAVREFIKARDEKCVIFTKGTTESINMVMHVWGRLNIQKGDRILLSQTEHHANIVPWQILSQMSGCFIDFIPLYDDRPLTWDDVKPHIKPRTKLLGLTHVSNALGMRHDVYDICTQARQNDITTCIDGAQAICHEAVDVEKMNCDFYAFSGHKLYGPTGIGVLYIHPDLVDTLPPFLGGGDMIETVTKDGFTPAKAPAKFEAGTPPIAEAIGLHGAIDCLMTMNMDRVKSHDKDLCEYALNALKKIDGIVLYGPQTADNRAGIISFNMKGIHPHDMGTFLDHKNIALRTGHHCNQILMDSMGVPATCRISFGVYNTTQDIDVLCDALTQAKRFFRQ